MMLSSRAQRGICCRMDPKADSSCVRNAILIVGLPSGRRARRRCSGASRRSAGSTPTSRPMPSISPSASSQLFSAERRDVDHAAAAGADDRIRAPPTAPAPSTPPITTSSTDSASTIASTLTLEKPIVFSTASSRHALAHRLRHGVAGQQQQGEEHRAHDRADDQADVGDLLHPRSAWRACSVWVLVSWSELADSASIALATRSAWLTSATRLTYQPTWPRL